MNVKVSVIILLFVSLSSVAQVKPACTSSHYVRAMKQATDIMVNDVTSPIAAARYYAYISLAASEALNQISYQKGTLAGAIRDYPILTLPDSVRKLSDPSATAILCIYKTSSRLLPSGRTLNLSLDSVLLELKRKMKPETLHYSLRASDSIVQHIITYSQGDGFRKLSGMKRYTPTTGDEYWQPTPPAFMSALEPYWNTLRPFTLDSSSQFKPAAPVAYSSDTASDYFSLLSEVYSRTKSMNAEQREIALFWDCNPFALQQMGHLEFGVKKISPGGHWMGITGIACLKAKKNIRETALIHMVVAITLADAFISCWDEKYRSNRVRPETGIKRLIDPMWQPLLQTPPFPEYPSGHSVISTAAATVLTKIFGANFSYADDSETEFGLPPRKFSSFLHAAQEASISRLYGGIHYRDAIEHGITEGTNVGQWVITKFFSAGR